MSTIHISMTRPDPSHPWGFRMAGGRDFGAPLIIKKVNPKSLSGRHGVEVGDRLLSISGDPCDRMSHQDAQMAVTRSANDLDLVLLRIPGAASMIRTGPAPAPAPSPAAYYPAPVSPVSPGIAGDGSWSSNASHSSGQPSPGIYRSNRGIQLRPGGAGSDHNDGVFFPASPPHSAGPAKVPSYMPGPTNQPWRASPTFAAAPTPRTAAPVNQGRPAPKQPSAMNRLEKTMQQPGRPLPPGYKPGNAGAPAKPGQSSRRGQSQRHQAGTRGPADRDPICDSCHALIRGPFIVALDRCFCPEHFRCSQCGIRMEDCGFVEEGGLLYCDSDYARLLAPRCARCGLPVVEKIVTAMRQSWHPECFVCTQCKKPMAGSTPGAGEATFRVGDDNLPYCDEDWSKLFQAKCEGCGYPIDDIDQFVEAMGKNFHSSCFNCSACRVSLQGKAFFTRNGKAFCKAHARSAALF